VFLEHREEIREGSLKNLAPPSKRGLGGRCYEALQQDWPAKGKVLSVPPHIFSKVRA